jgi:hypothetical protein
MKTDILRKLSVTIFPLVYASVMSAGVFKKPWDQNGSVLLGNGKVVCRRLREVQGDGEKVNDVIFCGVSAPAESNVVFFGGDVQVIIIRPQNELSEIKT